jgi:hypothetical protein
MFQKISNAALRVRRFAWDERAFETISRVYRQTNAVPKGSSLHHWLIPRSARGVPEAIKNGGWNLLRTPYRVPGWRHHRSLGLNQWMGLSRNWKNHPDVWRGIVTEQVIQNIVVALFAGGAGYSYSIYEQVMELLDLLDDGAQEPLFAVEPIES